MPIVELVSPFTLPKFFLRSLKSHPFFEITYVYLGILGSIFASFVGCKIRYYVSILFPLLKFASFPAYDSFFIMMTLHCIAKLDVCCSYASKLGTPGHDTRRNIVDFAKHHLRTLDLIRTVSSIYNIVNLGQILTALGLFVVIGFQARDGLEYPLIVMIAFFLLQLFMYCSMSERINTMVRVTFK